MPTELPSKIVEAVAVQLWLADAERAAPNVARYVPRNIARAALGGQAE